MLKKWKKILKFLATTVILLIYVTIELCKRETLRGERNGKSFFNFPADSTTPSPDNHSPATIKTIVSYSREYRVRKELEDRIECQEAGGVHSVKEESGATSQWSHDPNLGIRLFSAYYDQRQEPYHYVRILGLIPRNASLYCQIWYENNETMTYVTQKAVTKEIWSSSWGSKTENCDEEGYPAIISCLAPPRDGSVIPSRVSFVNKDCVGGRTFVKIISSQPQPSAKKNFVVCVKPLHFTNVNEKTFQEWTEINYRLGAEKIVVYLSNFSDTNSILAGGKKTEILAKKRFETPKSKCSESGNFEGSVWYKRKLEIVAYNDCFYSNLYEAKFVIPLDVDEIIVPKTGNDWSEAFRSHFKLPGQNETFWPENYASFSVRNAYFFSKYPEDAIFWDFELPNRDRNVPKKLVKILRRKKRSPFGGTIFDRTVRSYRLSPKSDSVKSFVHVPKTLSVFNHFTFHVLGDATQQQYIFPQTVFQLNHYRNSCDPVLIDGCQDFLNQVVYDDSLEKFRRREKISSACNNRTGRKSC